MSGNEQGDRAEGEPKGTRSCFCDIDRNAFPLVGTEEGLDDDPGIRVCEDLEDGVSTLSE